MSVVYPFIYLALEFVTLDNWHNIYKSVVSLHYESELNIGTHPSVSTKSQDC